MQTSASVRLMSSGLGDARLLHTLGGVWLTSPNSLSFRVGELLGGTTGRAGPIRRIDSVCAKDNVLFLERLSLLELAHKDILDAMCVILCVSS